MPDHQSKADLERLIASLVQMRDTLTDLSLVMKDLAFETLHTQDEELAKTMDALIKKAKQPDPPSTPPNDQAPTQE
jgi:hypothetical protein